MAWVPLGAQAQSACTAMWGLGTGGELQYFNTASNSWVTAQNPAIAGNGLAGWAGDGSLYYMSAFAAPRTVKKVTFSNSTGTMTVSDFGTVADAPTATLVTSTGTIVMSFPNILGATMDLDTVNRRMFLYAVSANTISNVTGGTATNVAAIGLLDPESPGAISWKVLYQSANSGAGTFTYPIIGASGDIFTDSSGSVYIATNSNPNRMVGVTLNYTGLTLNSAQAVTTAVIQVPSGTARTGSIGGIATNPVDGTVYISSGSAGTDRITSAMTANPVIGTNVAAGGVSDSGNCPIAPARPGVQKTVNPVGASGTIGTATLTITITNPNKVPIFLMQGLTDTFPTNMVISTTPSLAGSCFSDGTVLATRPPSATITGAAGAGSAVVAAGALIPGGTTSGGSCSFSVRVSATVANLYSNTIPAGSLTTTAGTNTSVATATFAVRATDFSIAKTQQAGSGTSSLTSGTITVGAGRTFTYALTIVNSSSGVTATATFTDTIPQLLTPVLTVSATPTGGGACSIATATVAVRTQVTGTFTSAPPGATCTVLIQGRATTTVAASTNINNTTGLTTTVVDFTSSNNQATVTTTLSPAALLTIAKTNNSTTLSAGQTTSYTITLANLGAANAPNASVQDGTSTGLSCTTVTCVVSAGTAACPASLTMSGLQTAPGLTIPTFNANSTLSFRVTCLVTATGP